MLLYLKWCHNDSPHQVWGFSGNLGEVPANILIQQPTRYALPLQGPMELNAVDLHSLLSVEKALKLGRYSPMAAMKGWTKLTIKVQWSHVATFLPHIPVVMPLLTSSSFACVHAYTHPFWLRSIEGHLLILYFWDNVTRVLIMITSLCLKTQ